MLVLPNRLIYLSSTVASKKCPPPFDCHYVHVIDSMLIAQSNIGLKLWRGLSSKEHIINPESYHILCLRGSMIATDRAIYCSAKVLSTVLCWAQVLRHVLRAIYALRYGKLISLSRGFTKIRINLCDKKRYWKMV